MHRRVRTTAWTHAGWRAFALPGALALGAALMLAATPAASAQQPRHGQVPPVRIALSAERVPGLFDHHARAFGPERVKGRWTLLTFGFTQCSSTCPASLLQAQQIAHELGDAVQLVFVTLDPQSDTPERLRGFLGQVHPRIVGVTGQPRAIEALVERFRVGVRAGARGELEHSTMWYLIGPQGEVLRFYRLATPVADIIDDLRALGTATGRTAAGSPS